MTTRIKVDVEGHADISGVYTGAGGGIPWLQEGGNGKIATSGYNSEADNQTWFVYDNSDLDPNGEQNSLFSWSSTSGESPFPWSDLASNHGKVKITADIDVVVCPSRDREAGVTDIPRFGVPLTDTSTEIKVTVAGHADISGIYTGTTVAGATWNQQGGNGTIAAYSFNETDGYEYILEDGSDLDPQYLLNNASGFTDRPWKAVLPSGVTMDGKDSVTVKRTALVHKSDRKGESRPLLSKVVGGAAAAYSLRDLNDKAGNNKVVEVRRSSDDADRIFLAKEVANGTLEAWVGAGNNGFVSKWYDQSGNGNDAEQATAGSQPKIVNSGALVVDNGIAGLDFDGGDFLVASSVSGLESPFSIFSTSVRDSNGYTASLSRSSAANRYFAVFESSGTSIAVPRNSTSGVTVAASVSGADRLTFALTTGATSTSVGAKGGTVVTTTDDYGNDFTSSSSLDQIAIGVQRTVSPTGYFNGRIREIIFYTSDQSANRPAIEANINNQYDIY